MHFAYHHGSARVGPSWTSVRRFKRTLRCRHISQVLHLAGLAPFEDVEFINGGGRDGDSPGRRG